MREASQPTSSFTAKQAICAFLISSGVYTLFNIPFERQSGLKMMTFCLAGMSIGYGWYHLYDEQPLKREVIAEPEPADKIKQ